MKQPQGLRKVTLFFEKILCPLVSQLMIVLDDSLLVLQRGEVNQAVIVEIHFESDSEPLLILKQTANLCVKNLR